MAAISLRTFLEPMRVSDARRRAVLDELMAGVQPSITYFLLLGLATMIASFGLLASSTAVVIGAMLVSPLMTPMFGVSIGVTRGDAALIARAMTTVASGTLLCVGLAFVLGLMPFALEITAEMLARTRPTLLDLLVAACAGFAACLTWIDERVSPVLPGVAIATSLVPPLATCGLVLAMGSYAQAWGAFLLFFANFVAIVAISAAVFLAFGFVRAWETESKVALRRGIWGTVGALLAVGALLTYSLTTVVRDWTLQRQIERVIAASFADDPNTSLDKIAYRRSPDGEELYVLSTLRTPRVVSPVTVRALEQALERELGAPVSMHVRCVITRDVAPLGAEREMLRENLDGSISRFPESGDAVLVTKAERLIREYLAESPRTTLDDIFMLRLDGQTVLVAELTSTASVMPYTVGQVEERLREYTGDASIRLLVRTVEATDLTAKGRVLLGGAHFVAPGADRAAAEALEQRARSALEAVGEIVVDDIDAVVATDGWRVRAEVTGSRVLGAADLRPIEQKLGADLGMPVWLSVLSRAEVLATGEGEESRRQVLERAAAERFKASDERIRQFWQRPAAGVPESTSASPSQ